MAAVVGLNPPEGKRIQWTLPLEARQDLPDSDLLLRYLSERESRIVTCGWFVTHPCRRVAPHSE